MLSKNKCKFINSLRIKKFRDQHQLFVVEGEKLTIEILKSELKIAILISTEEWINRNSELLNFNPLVDEILTLKADELKKISDLISVPDVMAVVKIPEISIYEKELESKLTLILEDVQNPGNMGTIIRLADWFGIENIICSPYCADIYNSKVVQASMGAICRVKIFHRPLNEFLNKFNELKNFQIYGTFLHGENIYETDLSNSGFIVFGNEGKGISVETSTFIKRRLFIPSFSSAKNTSESLNVAVAASIVCSEFRRRTI